MITRRRFLTGTAAAAGGVSLLRGVVPVNAQTVSPPATVPLAEPGRDYTPVITPNNVSLPWKIVDGVKAKGNPNFGVMYDTCHAHMCAAVGANQVGHKETLPGGALELLDKLKGKITHVHLIDSDGSLNEHNTSTHNPFGTGKLDFGKLLPALNKAGVPNDWWVVDLCFWPDAWSVTADSKRFLDKMRKQYAG